MNAKLKEIVLTGRLLPDGPKLSRIAVAKNCGRSVSWVRLMEKKISLEIHANREMALDKIPELMEKMEKLEKERRAVDVKAKRAAVAAKRREEGGRRQKLHELSEVIDLVIQLRGLQRKRLRLRNARIDAERALCTFRNAFSKHPKWKLIEQLAKTTDLEEAARKDQDFISSVLSGESTTNLEQELARDLYEAQYGDVGDSK